MQNKLNIMRILLSSFLKTTTILPQITKKRDLVASITREIWNKTK